MNIKCSDSLIRFKELIKHNNKRKNSKKRENEIRDLLAWFVNNCPSQNGPETAKKFADYGIKSSNDYKKFKRQIIDILGLKKDESYIFCENGTEMEKLIEKIEKIYSSSPKAIIYFSKSEHKEIDSLYIRIRNSFAHGNYFKIRDYYYLWNETGNGQRAKKLGSFMILKYEHLNLIYKALLEYCHKTNLK